MTKTVWQTVLMVALASAFLGACSDTQTKTQDKTPKSNQTQLAQSVGDMATEKLTGCYAIDKQSPAQIWVHRQENTYVMQMKEAADKQQTWDNPETLTTPELAQAWKYFQTNTLDLAQSDVEAVVARPDGLMAIAKIKDTVPNINPLLDSPYVMHLMGAVKTVYQVACDEVRLEMADDIHGH